MQNRTEIKKILLIALSAALAALASYIIYAGIRPPAPKASDTMRAKVESLISRHGISSRDLLRVSEEKKRALFRSYVITYKEYAAPRSFSFKNFEAGLKASLLKTGFNIAKSDRLFTKDSESAIFEITYGRFKIFTLKINKRTAAAPAVTKVFKNPKVAVVIDDFGYNMNNVDAFVAIKKPLTFSILPNLPYSKSVAGAAASNGMEVILHLPLEPHDKNIKTEAGTINSVMDDKTIIKTLDAAIMSVPGLKGVSNHEGSKSTEDARIMTAILRELKRKGLYFFDSLTSQKSVCREVAASLGVAYASRDIFLDNESNVDHIKKQLMALRRMAFRKGRVIAICHDRKNTASALSEIMPELAGEGIEFVSLSEMVR